MLTTVIILSIVSFLLLFALVAALLALRFMWRSSRIMLIEYNRLKDAHENKQSQVEEALDEVIAVVGGDLYRYLERLKKAEVSIVYTNEIATVFRYILNAHRDIYNIMSNHKLITEGKSLPPYIMDARHAIEDKYIHVKEAAGEGGGKRKLPTGDFVGINRAAPRPLQQLK